MATNPADKIKPPSFRNERFKPVLPPLKEVINILETLKGTHFYVPAMIAFYCGMRRGEILALKWSHVNLDEGAFIVNETLFPSEEGLVSQLPKNASSIRVVAFPQSLAPILKEQKNIQDANRLKFGEYYRENGLICCQEDGAPYNPDSFSGMFGEFIKKHNLPHIRFHDLASERDRLNSRRHRHWNGTKTSRAQLAEHHVRLQPSIVPTTEKSC